MKIIIHEHEWADIIATYHELENPDLLKALKDWIELRNNAHTFSLGCSMEAEIEWFIENNQDVSWPVKDLDSKIDKLADCVADCILFNQNKNKKV